MIQEEPEIIFQGSFKHDSYFFTQVFLTIIDNEKGDRLYRIPFNRSQVFPGI